MKNALILPPEYRRISKQRRAQRARHLPSFFQIIQDIYEERIEDIWSGSIDFVEEVAPIMALLFKIIFFYRLFHEGAKYQDQEEELGHLIVDEPVKQKQSKWYNECVFVLSSPQNHMSERWKCQSYWTGRNLLTGMWDWMMRRCRYDEEASREGDTEVIKKTRGSRK